MENPIEERKRMVQERIEKSFNDGLNLNDEIEKGRHGIYADNAENRRKNRVGQEYGHAAQQKEPTGKTAGAAKTVDEHAAEASDKALERAAADKNAEPEVREAAKKELAQRNSDDDKKSMYNDDGEIDMNHPLVKRRFELMDKLYHGGKLSDDEQKELDKLHERSENDKMSKMSPEKKAEYQKGMADLKKRFDEEKDFERQRNDFRKRWNESHGKDNQFPKDKWITDFKKSPEENNEPKIDEKKRRKVADKLRQYARSIISERDVNSVHDGLKIPSRFQVVEKENKYGYKQLELYYDGNKVGHGIIDPKKCKVSVDDLKKSGLLKTEDEIDSHNEGKYSQENQKQRKIEEWDEQYNDEFPSDVEKPNKKETISKEENRKYREEQEKLDKDLTNDGENHNKLSASVTNKITDSIIDNVDDHRMLLGLYRMAKAYNRLSVTEKGKSVKDLADVPEKLQAKMIQRIVSHINKDRLKKFYDTYFQDGDEVFNMNDVPVIKSIINDIEIADVDEAKEILNNIQ